MIQYYLSNEWHNSYRELVQLVERWSPKPDVVSSSLTFPAIIGNNPKNWI